MGQGILIVFSLFGTAIALVALYHLLRRESELHNLDCTCNDCDLYRYEGLPHD